MDVFVKWTVECFQFVLPLVVNLFLFTLLFLVEEILPNTFCRRAVCFSREEKSFVTLSQTFKIQLTVCCPVLLFVQLSDQWHFIHFQFHCLRGAVVCHGTVDKELELTTCEVLSASN